MEYQIKLVPDSKASSTDVGNLLEKLAAEALKIHGYYVTNQVRLIGSEIDLFCRHKVSGERIYVECKGYSGKKIPSSELRQLLGTVQFEKFSAGWLITTTSLTKDAKGFAEAWQQKEENERRRLRIYDPEKFIQLLIDTSLICDISRNSINDIEFGKYITKWVLFITTFGIFWVAYIKFYGNSQFAFSYDATTCEPVNDKESKQIQEVITSNKNKNIEYKKFEDVVNDYKAFKANENKKGIMENIKYGKSTDIVNVHKFDKANENRKNSNKDMTINQNDFRYEDQVYQMLIKSFPELEEIYMKANKDKQFETIHIYYDLVEKNPIDKISNPLYQEYVVEFIRGVLLERKRMIQNAGLGLIRDVVEQDHIHLAQVILDNLFNGDPGLLQLVLKVDNSMWKKWGLSKWAFLYQEWNRNQILYAVLNVPDEVKQKMSNLGNLRNRLAHNENFEDIDTLRIQVLEAFNHAIIILLWIDEARNQIQNPKVPLNIARAISISEKQSKQLEFLSSIQVKQDDMLNLVKNMKNQSEEEWIRLASTLEKIQKGTVSIDENTQAIIRDFIIPQLKEDEQQKAQRVFDNLLKSNNSIASEVFVTIIAGLISRALRIG